MLSLKKYKNLLHYIYFFRSLTLWVTTFVQFFQKKQKNCPGTPPEKCNVGKPIKWLFTTLFGFALSCSTRRLRRLKKVVFEFFLYVLLNYEKKIQMSYYTIF